jgi:hypothetical protein
MRKHYFNPRRVRLWLLGMHSRWRCIICSSPSKTRATGISKSVVWDFVNLCEGRDIAKWNGLTANGNPALEIYVIFCIKIDSLFDQMLFPINKRFKHYHCLKSQIFCLASLIFGCGKSRSVSWLLGRCATCEAVTCLAWGFCIGEERILGAQDEIRSSDILPQIDLSNDYGFPFRGISRFWIGARGIILPFLLLLL